MMIGDTWVWSMLSSIINPSLYEEEDEVKTHGSEAVCMLLKSASSQRSESYESYTQLSSKAGLQHGSLTAMIPCNARPESYFVRRVFLSIGTCALHGSLITMTLCTKEIDSHLGRHVLLGTGDIPRVCGGTSPADKCECVTVRLENRASCYDAKVYK